MAKKKSFLDTLKSTMLESDESPEAAEAATAPTLSHIPAVTATQVPPAYTGPVTSSVVQSGSDVVDSEALKFVREGVYAETISGRPSRYITFLRMYEAVGRNAAVALNALKVTDPSITPASVVADIDQHEQLLANFVERASGEMKALADGTVGQSDKEVEHLRKLNADAKAEIERHTRETAERDARIGTITTERAEHEAKLARARKRTSDAENAVRAELAQMKQTLSAAR